MNNAVTDEEMRGRRRAIYCCLAEIAARLVRDGVLVVASHDKETNASSPSKAPK